MSRSPMHTILNMLSPIEEYYGFDEHEEIAINQPGQIWCRRHKPDAEGNLWVPIRDERFTLEYLTTVSRAIANAFDKKFDPNDPSKPCTIFQSLPPFDHRFAAIVGNSVTYDQSTPEGGVALCIRKGAKASRSFNVSFADYGLIEGEGVKDAYHQIKQITDGHVDAIKALKDSVENGCNIIISGGTSTGKTTLFNRLIEEVDPRTRIITVEDTREIKLPLHPNHVHLILERNNDSKSFSYSMAVDLIMRFTPDIVLVGEISTTNAGSLWRLTGTGHGAMMTTIHASTVEDCYKTIADRIMGCIPSLDRGEIIEKIKEQFVVIQLNRNLQGERIISDIRVPGEPVFY